MNTSIESQRLPPPAIQEDDFSTSFYKVRSQLADDSGQRYVEFLRTLQPDFRRVYRDIAFGYAMLLATAVVAVWLLHKHAAAGVVIVASSLSFGFWIAYLQLFLHEAAHFNLARDRGLSDRLGNLLIAWLVGTNIAQYRKVHFQHHRALGTVDDTEFSYFFPLNIPFLLKSLCGLRAIEVVLARKKHLDRRASRSGQIRVGTSTAHTGDGLADEGIVSGGAKFKHLIAGMIAHAALLVILWQVASWPLVVSWIIGVGVVFPFFAALRPLLEHRHDTASNTIDYRVTDQGAYTRLFGDDPLSSTIGAAGFNRHLLHHWEPQVSYTRLAELETFLAGTSMGPVMDSRRSGYGAVLMKFLSFY